MKIFKYSLLILVVFALVVPITSHASFWWPFVKNSDNGKAVISDRVEKAREMKVLPSRSPKASLSPRPTPNMACAQSAIQTRETAIMSALDAFNSLVKTALQTRSTALVAAWGLSNAQDRNIAVKKAGTDYSTSARAAAKTLKLSRQDTWKAYRTSLKSCAVTSAPVELETNDLPTL